ncbi:hypothetical protein BsWGS_02225 [Bradybaena similaris]
MALGQRNAEDTEYLQRKTKDTLSQLHHFETIIPQLVDHHGNFISYDVTHNSALRHFNLQHRRNKRWAGQASTKSSPSSNFYLDGTDQIGRSSVFYKLSAYGRDFHFNLTLNTQLLTKDFAVELWKDAAAARSADQVWDCHYVGTSTRGDNVEAAISNCNGLHGVFSTDTDDYFVEPLWNHTNLVGVEGHPHIVYSRASLKLGETRYCGVQDYKRRKYNKWHRKRPGSENEVLKPGEQSAFWEWRPQTLSRRPKPKQRVKRSVSTERHVETLVVIDKKMKDYHAGSQPEGSTAALTTYVLTIMNIVAKLFHNPTIGNAINIIVTRLVVITAEQGEDLPQINHHADKSLDSFCKWQFQLIENSTDSSVSHDNAVLITRYDICTYKNDPCGTLGLAPVDGMCEKERSCSINQDIGLASAFTIAHEIGHK